MSNNNSIIMENVWKNFPIQRDRPGFKEFLIKVPSIIKSGKNVFSAIKGIDLSVKKGDCVGIIGRNGAGKSTLLSLMLGTIKPTKGKVHVFGKRTPLLELGSGFHTDLTGIENILMNGVLLGLIKEQVLERMDDIIAFSELGGFIGQPLRTYSSGMYMRLAFSVAINTKPEILLIDEVLGVGDEAFQKKSREALMDLIKGGVTTVYVSHNLDSVIQICDKAIWLEQGEVKENDEPGKVVENYLKHT